jgi:hypothetical protein
MDIEDVRRLARDGTAAFPPDRLATAADWLYDFSEATGDARYSSLARTLATIGESFDGQSERMLADTVEEIDEALKAIPEVLNIATPADAALLARRLREQVAQILRNDVQRVDHLFREKRSR